MRALAIAAAFALALAAPVAGAQTLELEAARVAPLEHPAGVYALDPTHTSVIWRVDHLGLSKYTGRFNAITGSLTLDSESPLNSSVQVTIEAASVDTGHRNDEGEARFDQTVATRALGAETQPLITFASTRVESADGVTGSVTGDLTMNGVTRPVTLAVTFNGGRFVALTQKYTIGFSGRAVINRSDFGVTPWASAVGDAAEIVIEAEFRR